MSDKITYTLDYDETFPTRERDGVVEHKHIGFDYWHPLARKHEGCGRTDGGKEYDVRMCLACDCVSDFAGCDIRRRQLGLIIGNVAHGVEPNKMISYSGTGFDYLHPIVVAQGGYSATDSIDMADTLLMIDEAVAELVSAKSMLARVGKDSDHVQHAKFEQFTRNIDEVVSRLLDVGRHVYEDMEAARNGKTNV